MYVIPDGVWNIGGIPSNPAIGEPYQFEYANTRRSQDSVAVDFISHLSPLSSEADQEYGGWIYDANNGGFGLSLSVGNVHSVDIQDPNQALASVGAGQNDISAMWHTHTEGDYFSGKDLKLSYDYGVDGYLGTATGAGSAKYENGYLIPPSVTQAIEQGKIATVRDENIQFLGSFQKPGGLSQGLAGSKPNEYDVFIANTSNAYIGAAVNIAGSPTRLNALSMGGDGTEVDATAEIQNGYNPDTGMVEITITGGTPGRSPSDEDSAGSGSSTNGSVGSRSGDDRLNSAIVRSIECPNCTDVALLGWAIRGSYKRGLKSYNQSEASSGTWARWNKGRREN